MDFAATYPDMKLQYFARNIILHANSDTAYLIQSDTCSWIIGYYILSKYPNPAPPIPKPVLNVPILVECKTVQTVIASTAKVETGGLFHNGQTIIHIWHLLHALGHSQPPTPLKTDNSTSNAFINNSFWQKKSKSWDIKFHWLQDKEQQQHLQVFWDRGHLNRANYFTKHHPAPDH